MPFRGLVLASGPVLSSLMTSRRGESITSHGMYLTCDSCSCIGALRLRSFASNSFSVAIELLRAKHIVHRSGEPRQELEPPRMLGLIPRKPVQRSVRVVDRRTTTQRMLTSKEVGRAVLQRETDGVDPLCAARRTSSGA